MKKIVQISDLHFGTIKPGIDECLLDCIREIEPELVVVSGDLTQRATHKQFQKAQRFLSKIPFPLIVVPGNHDVPSFNAFTRFLRPLNKYQQYITNDLFPFYQDNEMAVLGINTARSYIWKNGSVSEKQLKLICDTFKPLSSSIFKILVTHHPFLSRPKAELHVSSGRVGAVLPAIEECNLDMLLAGHFHMSYSSGTHTVRGAGKRSTLVIQAGTAASKRVRHEYNAFNVIHFHNGHVILSVRIWNGRAFVEEKVEKFQYIHERWEKEM